MNLADLKNPFDPDRVSWRVGSTTQDKSKGMALAYIDARDVQDRLDEVCGVMGWQSRYVPMHDKKTVCEIGIYSEFHQCWVWKSDGAGDSDIEAEKGALSDSFKRAAVRWGVGRYLYDVASPWVALEAAGKSFKIAAHEYKRLEALLAGNALRAPQTPTQTQTNQPAPSVVPGKQEPQKPPKMTALEWAKASMNTIRAINGAELDSWASNPANAKALDKLKTEEPVAYGDIQALINKKRAEYV